MQMHASVPFDSSAEWDNCYRHHMAREPEIFTVWHLTESVGHCFGAA